MAARDVDVRQIIASIGGLPPGGAESAVDLRDCTAEVTMLEKDDVEIVNEPAAVSGWIDGVEASLPLTWVSQRMLLLSWVAAGSATTSGVGGHVDQTMWIGCSFEDAAVANSIAYGAEVMTVNETDPIGVRLALRKQLGDERELAERAVCSKLLKEDEQEGLIICDGPIVARTNSERVCGVVKSHATQYFEDNRQLYGLRPGWRSPAFEIKSKGKARYSCYVRLQDAETKWWDFGLVRLETFNPKVLDGLAAVVLRERQVLGSKDGRWDRHLATVRYVEDWLRQIRPTVFSAHRR
jgi:hypothetical protein